jgi:NADPH:quinone reductase-like Zn-dependent oxidoreductase
VLTSDPDAVFDYNSPTCVADIKAFAKDNIAHVLDCIAKEQSIKISAAAIRPSGGVLSTLLQTNAEQVAAINANVKLNMTLAYTILGEAFTIRGHDVPASPEDYEFAKKFWDLSAGLLASGKVKVHRPAVNKYGSGLEGVLKGLDAMREGNVSGEKLVFTL